MKNRIYFFTGTGNSLQAARTIASTINDCELVAIRKDISLQLPDGYERIGFVFPNYAGGPPNMVAEFINNMQMPKGIEPYLFAVVTYGGFSGTVLARVEELLKHKGQSLNYGNSIRSYPNLVTAYPMIKGVGFFTRISKCKTKKIAKEITNMKQKPISETVPSTPSMYEDYIGKINDSDMNFYANDECISCGLCEDICPAKNITMRDCKPVFHHQCESCMACIQYCPKKALNDKEKTEKRGRYTNPNITAQTIIKLQEQTI